MDGASLGIAVSGLLEQLDQPALAYGVCFARWPESMVRQFVQFGPDQSLLDYLTRAKGERASRARTWIQRALGLVLSDYDANALLRMYPMHLLSTAQAEVLLDRARGGRLLDIGAGSGDVTRSLLPLFDAVEVVESSRWSRRRLHELGLKCHDYDVAKVGIQGAQFDVIALLNVLDRTERPLTLLERCRQHMTEETRLLLSIPLPYRPHFYRAGQSLEPKERLAVVGNDFSDSLMRLVRHVLLPMGLRVDKVTRLPYLSGGDSRRPLAVLDAAVLTCRSCSV